ncbi:MAG: cation transporter [Deltaproteobacteria bacterium]|nr:cation transporter [Deltaproteobacteria bacterium]
MIYAKEVRKVLWVTFILNLFVAGVKIVYGSIAGINSIQADGFHSLFDGASNVIGLVGMWLAAKPPDESHHYGHKKFETMATVGIATLLFLACIEILQKAVQNLLNPKPLIIANLSFAVVIITMGINLFVIVYEYKRGKNLKSDFLVADAKHTVSDFMASVIVLSSLAGMRLGYPYLDSIASILIAGMIAYVGYHIIKEASDVLADASPLLTGDVAKIEAIAMAVEGVQECHSMRVRGRADAIHVDCHLLVLPEMSIADAHEIASQVEKKIKHEMPQVVDVVVHLEPYEIKKSLKNA